MVGLWLIGWGSGERGFFFWLGEWGVRLRLVGLSVMRLRGIEGSFVLRLVGYMGARDGDGDGDGAGGEWSKWVRRGDWEVDFFVWGIGGGCIGWLGMVWGSVVRFGLMGCDLI